MVEYNKPPVLKKISLVFTGIVIVILLLVIYIFFGQAEIKITPNIKAVNTTFDILVKPEVEATDGSMMPGDIFFTNESISQAFPVQNMTEELPGKASGKISIINNNSSDQTLVATTRFLTPDNILFRLDDRVVVPSGGKISANITADQPGAQGDIKPQLKLSIPGLNQTLQQRIYGEVEEPFTGGVIKQGTLTAADISQAQESLKRQFEEEFQINYLSEYFTNSSTTTPGKAPDLLTNFQINSETINAEIGDLINEFVYTVDANIEGVAINKSELEIIAQNKLKSSLAASEQFIGIIPGSFSISLKEIDTNNKTALLEVSIAGQSIYTQTNSIVDKTDLIGMNEPELKSYFTNISGIESVAIKFRPFWVKQVPRIKNNINILIEDVR